MQTQALIQRSSARFSKWWSFVGSWLDRQLGVLFILPGLICLLIVIAYPVVYNLFYSFTDKSLIYPNFIFVNFENFTSTLGDPDFWDAVRVNIIWTLASVGIQLLLGFIAALSLEQIRRGQTLFRVLLIIPWTFPSIVMAFVWRWMFDGLYGVVNYFLLLLGLIPTAIAWFGTPDTALGTVIAMNFWFGFPFMMVAILAGLQTIPSEHHDVATIEGANYLQRLRYVIFPALRGIVGILVVLRSIWVFNNFDFIYLTTGGGPGNLTQTLPIYAFHIGWLQYQVGRMAAVAILMMVVLGFITFIYFRLLRIEEEGALQ